MVRSGNDLSGSADLGHVVGWNARGWRGTNSCQEGVDGTPDLVGCSSFSGIWNSKTMTPLERHAKFANRECLTDVEIPGIEQTHGQESGRDVRARKRSEADVEGAYNNIFSTALGEKYARTKRSSLIVDP